MRRQYTNKAPFCFKTLEFQRMMNVLRTPTEVPRVFHLWSMSVRILWTMLDYIHAQILENRPELLSIGKKKKIADLKG